MLLSGVTTVADLSIPYEGWLNLLARSGMRVYAAPWYASARWYVQNRHELKYRWDEAAGRRGFAAALKLIDEAQAHPSGRLSGVIFPAQIDTCSEDLLRDSVAAARERKLPFTTHAAQSVTEFNVIVQRHGVTPGAALDDAEMIGAEHIDETPGDGAGVGGLAAGELDLQPTVAFE